MEDLNNKCKAQISLSQQIISELKQSIRSRNETLRLLKDNVTKFSEEVKAYRLQTAERLSRLNPPPKTIDLTKF